MSMEFGIFDFCLVGGIWIEDIFRMEVMSREYFECCLCDFWFKFKQLFQMKMSGSYELNVGYKYLVDFEKWGKQVDIFMQNIDGFYRKVGSSSVYEFYGLIQIVVCFCCGVCYGFLYLLKEEVLECMVEIGDYEVCGVVLKMDVVLFGDFVQYFEIFYEKFDKVDFFFVIGILFEVVLVRFVFEDVSWIFGLK